MRNDYVKTEPKIVRYEAMQMGCFWGIVAKLDDGTEKIEISGQYSKSQAESMARRMNRE